MGSPLYYFHLRGEFNTIWRAPNRYITSCALTARSKSCKFFCVLILYEFYKRSFKVFLIYFNFRSSVLLSRPSLIINNYLQTTAPPWTYCLTNFIHIGSWMKHLLPLIFLSLLSYLNWDYIFDWECQGWTSGSSKRLVKSWFRSPKFLIMNFIILFQIRQY